MDCPDTCSWVVTVKDGRAVKLQGDPTHPFTRGVLCNKLDDYVAYTQSPERLLYPMRRVWPKGAGDFERISTGRSTRSPSASAASSASSARKPYGRTWARAAWGSSRAVTARGDGSGTPLA